MTHLATDLTAEQAIAWLAERSRQIDAPIFLQGGPSEPLSLQAAWRADPEAAQGLTFVAVLLAGLNRFDYSTLTPSTRLRTFLPTADLSAGIAAGRVLATPLPYSAIPGALATTRWAAAVIHVAPPDGDGMCSLGLNADFAPALLETNAPLLGVVNHRMPTLLSAPRVPFSRFTAVHECDHPLATLDRAPSAAPSPFSKAIAGLINDGDCVQVGIGRLPSAALAGLTQKKDLRFFGGLAGKGHFDLIDAGCVADAPDAMVAGVIMGDATVYARAVCEPRLSLRDVRQTHAPTALAQTGRLIAINAVLEIDLHGQINAEWAGTRCIAGVGGLSDFSRAAMLSPGGRAICMIQARGSAGESRIVAQLSRPTLTLARTDADVIVSEYGVAALRHLDTEARAQALIAIAPPEAREALSAAWRAQS